MIKVKLQILVQVLRKCFIKKKIRIVKVHKYRQKTFSKLFLLFLKDLNLRIAEITSFLKSIVHKSMVNYRFNLQ